MSYFESYLSEEQDLPILSFLDGDYREKMISDIRSGMTALQKFIPSKYFYDTAGSDLFDRICHTGEYYLTSTELSILDSRARDIMAFFGTDKGDLIELGSGSPAKIKKLLDKAAKADLDNIRYIPMDICEVCLLNCLEELERMYEELKTLALLADFTRHMDALPGGRKLLLFLGSTIGNFTEEECHTFLCSIRRKMNPDDRFIIGMDMLKSVDVMEAAYNDSAGLTREFNLNVLKHINGKLNANFNIDDFEHVASFNPEREQIEMRLRARAASSVRISDLPLTVHFKKGETILTEICRKFRREKVEEAVRKAGFSVQEWFTDAKDWFSLVELEPIG